MAAKGRDERRASAALRAELKSELDAAYARISVSARPTGRDFYDPIGDSEVRHLMPHLRKEVTSDVRSQGPVTGNTE